MIELKNVSFSFGRKKILDNLSFTVRDGECLCLVGESGCGKSTAAKIVAGLLSADSGEVKTHDKISVVFQDDRLIPHLTLLENIKICVPKADEDYILSLLDRIGLSDAVDKKPAELSGGMARRAAIVRAIAYGGNALIIDEPFNGLDADSKAKSAEIIKEEFLLKGKPVLMISHVFEDAELLNAERLTLIRQR